MKFTTYNQQVNAPSGGGATLQISSDPNAYGGNGAGFAAMAKGVQQLAAGIEEHNEREDKATLMAFMNDMDTARYEMLHNQQNGYLNRQGQNAQGIAMDYTENIQKLTQDKLKQYKFKTNTYKLAALDMSTKSNRADYEKVDLWEQKQYMVTADLEHTKGLDLSIKQANLSYANPKLLAEQLDSQRKKAMLYASTRNLDKEQTDMIVKNDLGAMASGAIMSATKAGDFANAAAIRNQYNEYLSADQVSKLDSVLLTKQKADYARKTAEDFIAKGYTKEQVLAELKSLKMDGLYEERNMPMQDIEDKDLAGTNKNLVSAAKQLNGWVYKAFGKDIKVSGGRRSEEHNKAVNGSPTSYHLSGNALDINLSMFNDEQRQQIIEKAREMGFNSNGEDMYHDRGTGDHLHLILPEGLVKGNSRMLTTEEQDEVYRQFEMLDNRNKAVKREALSKFSEEQDDVISGLVGKADGLQQWNDLMNQYIGNKDKYKIMKSLRSTYFGGGGGNGSGAGGGKALTPYEQSALIQRMINGDFYDGVNDEYTKGLEYVSKKWSNSPRAIDTYKKLWNEKKQGKGAFSFNLDGVVADSVSAFKNNRNIEYIKRAAKTAAIMENDTYRNTHNGEDMPYKLLVQAVKEGVPNITYGSYKKNGTYVNSDVDLDLSPNRLKAEGIKLITKSTVGDTFAVHYYDGRVKSMTGDMIMELYGD